MFTDKIAIVTGAGRGIGKEIAKTLAAKGALVIVNYCGSAKRAEETVQEIEAAGGKAEALQCDISDFTKAGEMMDYVIKTYGRVDILVNNAGITRDGLLMKMSEEDFDAVLNTNLKGAFNCMRHVARQMVKQRGRPDHQHFLRIWCYGKCRTGQLFRIQSRNHWNDQIRSQRAGKPRYYR